MNSSLWNSARQEYTQQTAAFIEHVPQGQDGMQILSGKGLTDNVCASQT